MEATSRGGCPGVGFGSERQTGRQRRLRMAGHALAGTLALAVSSHGRAQAVEEAEQQMTAHPPELLSERGSTRATRYATANKIVTLVGRTHVAWLDSVSRTVVATYDHGTDAWGATVLVGEGKDNHGGPALTCDSNGFLHIVFGPHGGPFQYCRSARPNDTSEWVKLPDFGQGATYPSTVFDDRDTLHIIYRGGNAPMKMLYQRKPADGPWGPPTTLARAPIKSGYTHYHSALTIAPDQSLHISYDIYHSGAAKEAGHMVSRDRGATWTLADGSPLALPVTPESDVFFKRADKALKTGGIVCDSKSRPWIIVSGPELWHHDGKAWRTCRPADLTSPPIADGTSHGADAPAVDSSDRIYVPVTVAGGVAVLASSDGARTFRRLDVHPRHAKLPHTGLNFERPTGHHSVRVPWLLFSTGEKGPDCYGKGIFHEVRVVQLGNR